MNPDCGCADMSTILDALRRAEAERGRGAVPGLHAQSLHTGGLAAGAAGEGAARWRLPLLAAAAGLAVLGAAVWWLQPSLRAPGAGDSGTSAAAPAVVGARSVPAPAPATTEPSPALLPAVPAVPTVAMPPAPPPPVATAAAAATDTLSTAPVSTPVPAPTTTARSPSPATPTGPSVPAPSAAPSQASLPAPVPLAALTPDQRRQWPPLNIGGSVYSDNAASRFVIANGQIVREGEAAAPGVTVERIGPRGAVLRWGQLRVEVPL